MFTQKEIKEFSKKKLKFRAVEGEEFKIQFSNRVTVYTGDRELWESGVKQLEGIQLTRVLP